MIFAVAAVYILFVADKCDIELYAFNVLENYSKGSNFVLYNKTHGTNMPYTTNCWFDTMTSSNGNIFRATGSMCRNSPVTGEFPLQRPVTRSFDVFFDLHLNKLLSKQP